MWQLQQQVLELRLSLAIRQWQQTHTSELVEGPPPTRAEREPEPKKEITLEARELRPPLTVSLRNGVWVKVHTGTTEPTAGWVEKGMIFVDGKWYPLSRAYRGIIDGQPVYAHPKLTEPKRELSRVTLYPDGSKVTISTPSTPRHSQIRDAIKYDSKRPYGHYAVLDEATGVVRYAPLPGFNPVTQIFDLPFNAPIEE